MRFSQIAVASSLIVFLLSTVILQQVPLASNQDEEISVNGTNQEDEQQDDDQQDGEQEGTEQEDDRLVIPFDDENAISRRDFMRTKLMFSQNIFEGLTVGDFDAIKESIEEVQMITEGEQWVAIDNDVYREMTEDFKKSTQRLMKAAETENIEATALRFYEMSTRCIDCHQHIRVAQYDF